MTNYEYEKLQAELSQLLNTEKYKQLKSKDKEVYKQAVLACKSVVSHYAERKGGGENGCETAKQIIADHINSLPAINIVHCKNCKYKVGENTEYNDAHCGIHERGNNRELTVGDYDYCSWGEVEE